MKYAEDDYPKDFLKRTILSEEDSLGLIWLSKIKIIGIICLFILNSCMYGEKSPTDDRELGEYFTGIVLNTNKKPLENVKVTMFIIDRKDSFFAYTNKNGFFKIKNKKINIDTLVLNEINLVFHKKQYQSDTVRTFIPYIHETRTSERFFFIYKTPDTIILK